MDEKVVTQSPVGDNIVEQEDVNESDKMGDVKEHEEQDNDGMEATEQDVDGTEVTDLPDMDDPDGKRFSNSVGDQSLITEETIRPAKASTTSSIRRRINLNRADNFRKLIRRKPSKDEAQDTDQVHADALAVSDNELNDRLESKHLSTEQDSSPHRLPDGAAEVKDVSPTHDSLGRPISGLGPIIAHTSLAEDDEDTDNKDDVMDDSGFEAGSIHTEDGINDSITNMDLLKGYVYSILVWILTKLWGLAEMGGSYVYNNYLAGETATTDSAASETGKDETDKDEEKQKQREASRKRVFNICNELLTTEREYAKRLKILTKIKARTASILQPDIAKSMFQNVEVIQQFHQDNLLPQLEERIATWTDQQKIGDIMRKLVPFLKLYTEYVKSFQKANALFEQWRQKSSTFALFVEEAENNIEFGRLKVQAHMLEPVQRVPRYELLLKDYLKHIPQESPDRSDAEEALQLVGGAAKHFEEMMKRDSRILELMRLQAQFEGTVNFVTSDRELLHHGKMREVNSRAGKISDRVLHLFNDVLLVSSHQKYLVQEDKFRVKHELPLKSAKVSYGNNLEVQYTFTVTTPDTVLELSASTAGERRMWMIKINRAVGKLNGTANIEEEINSNNNEITEEESQPSQRYTFQISADLKTWKKRIFSLHDNGLLTTSKTSNDRSTLASVHISNFHVGIGTVSQKRSKVLTLVGEHRTYYLYDESEGLVESWFEELKKSREQFSEDEDLDKCREGGFVRDSKSRMSTVSTDSGIDAMSYTSHHSQASFDSS